MGVKGLTCDPNIPEAQTEGPHVSGHLGLRVRHWGWTVVSVVKNTCYFFSALGFESQHL